MLSSPSTRPLYLPNVNANKKQTQLENRGPRFLCISSFPSSAPPFCCLCSDWTQLSTHGQESKQLADPELLASENWDMLENGVKTQPRLSQGQKTAGGWKCHVVTTLGVGYTCQQPGAPLLLSAQDLCWSGRVHLVAPRGLTIPSSLWGGREAVLKGPGWGTTVKEDCTWFLARLWTSM